MKRLLSIYNQLLEYAKRAYHSLLFPAVIVFFVIVMVAVWASRTADLSLRRNIQSGMDIQSSVVQRTIATRLQNHEQTLRSNAALLQSGENIDAAQWSTFINTYNHLRDFPSMRTIVAAHYSEDNSQLTVHYAWPDATDVSMGANLNDTDMYRNLAKSADNAAGVVIAPYTESPGHLLMGLPLYPQGSIVADGQTKGLTPTGLVFGILDTTTLFDRMLDSTSISNISMQVFTGTSTEPLYSSPGFDSAKGNIDMQKTFYFYSQAFRIHLRFPETALVSKTQLDGPILIMSGGFLAALMIASIVYLLLMTRAKELQIEKTHDVDLAKDDLLSLASHQLRTPATGVKQYLGMVLQGFAGSVTERQRSLLEKAFASNDRQLAVINEVLHLAKIEAGRITLAKQDTNLNELVQDIVNEQTQDIKRSEHTVSLQLPVRAVMVYVDNHMLRMAIENLVSNAIKYTPAKGKIGVSVVGSRNFARVVVRDSGVGIASKDLPNLFKQFTRFENEMSYQVGGTGVGLYLVKHLVELHGGKVTVSSRPNQGSTFAITIPRRQGLHQNKKNM